MHVRLRGVAESVLDGELRDGCHAPYLPAPRYRHRRTRPRNCWAQIQAALGRTLDLNDPLALNLYLTLPTNSLPLLEPLYLGADLTNLMTLGAFANMNPLGMFANAPLAPAITSLVNLGYTDVVRNPDGTTPESSTRQAFPRRSRPFPDINWGLVPGDIIHSLVNGFQKEFFSGHLDAGMTPNAITGLLRLLTGVLGPLGGLGDTPQRPARPYRSTGRAGSPANALPSADAKTADASSTTAQETDSQPTSAHDPRRQASSGRNRYRRRPKHNDEADHHKKRIDQRDRHSKPAGPSCIAQAEQPRRKRRRRCDRHCRHGHRWSTNTVGGVTGGVAGTVGGVTGGLTGALGESDEVGDR